MTTFRLAHISDPHLPPPALPFRWRDLASKRVLSQFAWRRKRRRHRREVLDVLIADIRAQGMDHLAITGDVTNFATPEEFTAARSWLQTLGDPSAVTLSPGNHDALTAEDLPDHFAAWAPWLGDAGGGFPYLRVRGAIAILNLSTAVRTGVHLAQGALGEDQLRRAGELLRETGVDGLYRVILIHHPPVAGLVSARKALRDLGAFQSLLQEVGADLVLHGHAHETLLSSVPGPGAPIPVMGVPSASTPAGLAHDQAARWNAIEVTRVPGGFSTLVRARSVNINLDVEPLGAFHLAI